MVKIELDLEDDTIAYLNKQSDCCGYTVDRATERMIEFGKRFLDGENNNHLKTSTGNCAHFCERCCMEEFRSKYCRGDVDDCCNRDGVLMCADISECLNIYCRDECEVRECYEDFEGHDEDGGFSTQIRPICVNIDCPNSEQQLVKRGVHIRDTYAVLTIGKE